MEGIPGIGLEWNVIDWMGLECEVIFTAHAKRDGVRITQFESDAVISHSDTIAILCENMGVDFSGEDVNRMILSSGGNPSDPIDFPVFLDIMYKGFRESGELAFTDTFTDMTEELEET
jgi:hypothetical protein